VFCDFFDAINFAKIEDLKRGRIGPRKRKKERRNGEICYVV